MTMTVTPQPTVTPSVTPPIQCGEAYTNAQAGQFWPNPYETYVYLGTDLGSVNVLFDTGNVPDKMQLFMDGIKVLDTGYYGDPFYQDQLNTILAAQGLPPETITKSAGVGEYNQFYFYKTSTTSTLTVNIYSPFGSGSWRYEIDCPQP